MRPAGRFCANDPEPCGNWPGARSISEIASRRGFARYSCCISTNTTIGTFDEFANVRRLTTEVTRLPFQGRDGLEAALLKPPGGTGLDSKNMRQNAQALRHAMVVVRP